MGGSHFDNLVSNADFPEVIRSEVIRYPGGDFFLSGGRRTMLSNFVLLKEIDIP